VDSQQLYGSMDQGAGATALHAGWGVRRWYVCMYVLVAFPTAASHAGFLVFILNGRDLSRTDTTSHRSLGSLFNTGTSGPHH